MKSTTTKKNTSTKAVPSNPAATAGIVIGIYVATDSEGRVWLQMPGNESEAVSAASCLCDSASLQPGMRVAVMFIEGRWDLPAVVGPILAEVTAPQTAGNLVSAAKNIPETIELTASKQIILKCGQAVLRLLSDGSAVIRGETVVSRAKRTNRIRGGNIQIN